MKNDIPILNNSENIKIWKSRIRSLFRENGVTQAEVASNMAKIVRRVTGEAVSSSTFISAISRFVNAKHSAFPGWFEKVDTRLLPLSLAIGLEDDQPLWQILQQSSGQINLQQSVWHPDWEGSNVRIPIQIQGKDLGQISQEIQKCCQEMLPVHRYPWFYILGPIGSGCHNLVEQLNTTLETPLPVLEFDVLERAENVRRHSKASVFAIVRDGHWIPNTLDRCFKVPMWGEKELKLVIEKLRPQVSNVDSNSLVQYIDSVNQIPLLMGFDRRATAVLSSLAVFLKGDLPSSPKEARAQLSEDQWTKACAKIPAVSGFGIRRWSQLCWMIVQRFPNHSRISYSSMHLLLKELEHSVGFRLHDSKAALGWLQEIADAPKKSTKGQINSLREWILLSTSEQSINLLLESEMLSHYGLEVGLPTSNQVIGWACLFPDMVDSFRSTMPAHPQFLLIIQELSANGLQWVQLKALLDPFIKHDGIFVAKAIIVFYGLNDGDLPKEVFEYWALVVASLFQPVLILSHEREILIEALQRISQKYASVLPHVKSSDAHDLWALLPPSSAQWLGIHPNRQQIQYLLPYQCYPINIHNWLQWQTRPPLNISAQEVLIWHSERGHIPSAKQLAESYMFPIWKGIPIQNRIQALGVGSVGPETLIAFEILVKELWADLALDLRKKPPYFDVLCDAVERCGWSTFLPLIQQWMSPKNCTAKVFTDHFSTLACGIYLSQYFGAHTELLVWWADIWEEGKWIFLETPLPEHKIGSFQAFLVVFSLAIAKNGHRSPIKSLWALYDKMSPLAAEKVLFESISEKAIEPIQKWLSEDWAPQLLKEKLSTSKDLLTIAWRYRGAERHSELLQWAGILAPVPDWAINEAMRETRNVGQWPRWLSPHRSESAPILKWMCANSRDENQFWWSTMLHRHQSWPNELMQALQFWLLEDPFPFTIQPWAISKALSLDNTPPLEPNEKLLLCAESLKLDHPPKWILSGLKRLWLHHRLEAKAKDIFLLGSILSPFGVIDLLNEGDELPLAFVRRQLPFVLIHSTNSQLQNAVTPHADRSLIVTAIQEELIRRGHLESIDIFEKKFLETTELYWLLTIAKFIPDRVLPLLQHSGLNRGELYQILPMLIPILPQDAGAKVQHWFWMQAPEGIGSEHPTVSPEIL